MTRGRDITGEIFGRLTVIKRLKNNDKGGQVWLCRCSCDGNEKQYLRSSLLSKNTQSCGCLRKEIASINMSKTFKKYNTYDLSGEYGIGYTMKGEEFYFDLEDYDKIKDYYWYKRKKLEYIEAYDNKIGKPIRMHRLILDVLNQKEVEPDHIFHIKYDNRKSQLRKATTAQNRMNAITRKDNTSGVKGVNWHKRDKIWQVHIQIGQKLTYIGRFTSFEEAVKVRKEAEDKYYGEYSYDNSMNLNKN